MAQVNLSAKILYPPEDLWFEIGGFQSVTKWHPHLRRLEGHGEEPGSVRKVEAGAGHAQKERLLERDSPHRLYRYELVETDLPVRNYVGEFQILADGRGASTVRWTADFEVIEGDEASAVRQVRDFFEEGLEALRARYRAREKPAA